MVFDYVIVGNGLLGAALALELVTLGRQVCLVGAEHGSGGIWYSGHHDDSRMVRLHHADPYWEDMTRHNAPLMQALEAGPGGPHFTATPVRFQGLSRSGGPASLRRRRGAGNELLQALDMEDEAGGIVHPLRYIESMNASSRALGLKQLRCVAREARQTQAGCEVQTDLGPITGRRVIHASGFHAARAVDELQVVGKVLLFANRPARQAGPVECFLDARTGDPQFADVYGFCDYRRTPEVAYTKFGFSESEPVQLEPAEIADWFQQAYLSHPLLQRMQAWVHHWHGGFAPTLDVEPCAYTVTADRRPGLWQSGPEYWFAGCNGMAAKCCQALARSAVAAIEPVVFDAIPAIIPRPLHDRRR